MTTPSPIAQFDIELNDQLANENSRCVKICILNLKCIIIFTFMILTFAYILIKEMFDEKEITVGMQALINLLANQSHLMQKININ